MKYARYETVEDMIAAVLIGVSPVRVINDAHSSLKDAVFSYNPLYKGLEYEETTAFYALVDFYQDNISVTCGECEKNISGKRNAMSQHMEARHNTPFFRWDETFMVAYPTKTYVEQRLEYLQRIPPGLK